jgi:cytochrome c oxidase subunit 4
LGGRLSHSDDSQSEHEEVGYGIYILTWIALLVLTAITVTVAGMHLGSLSILVALAVAAVKATLVLSFFMHLRYERPLFRIMFLVVIITLAIFIGLTFLDPPFRS